MLKITYLFYTFPVIQRFVVVCKTEMASTALKHFWSETSWDWGNVCHSHATNHDVLNEMEGSRARSRSVGMKWPKCTKRKQIALAVAVRRVQSLLKRAYKCPSSDAISAVSFVVHLKVGERAFLASNAFDRKVRSHHSGSSAFVAFRVWANRSSGRVGREWGSHGPFIPWFPCNR